MRESAAGVRREPEVDGSRLDYLGALAQIISVKCGLSF